MAKKLFECGVLPYYAQIEFGDPEAEAYPQWETGEELAVAADDLVAVGTQPRLDRSVGIEVWTGKVQPLPALLWEGHVGLAGDEAVVGSRVGNALHRIRIGRGRHRLRVWGDVAPRPSRIAFVLADGGR